MRFLAKFFIVFFVVATMHLSCTRTCPCAPAAMPIVLVSFTAAQVDTIIVRRFIKGTNFQILKDTLLADSTNFFNITTGKDTIQLASGSPLAHISSQFDFEIYFPSMNLLSQISAVVEESKEGACGRCVNFITSYNKDGKSYVSHELYLPP